METIQIKDGWKQTRNILKSDLPKWDNNINQTAKRYYQKAIIVYHSPFGLLQDFGMYLLKKGVVQSSWPPICDKLLLLWKTVRDASIK